MMLICYKDRKFVFLDLGMIFFMYQYNEMNSIISLVFISVHGTILS